jgi:hypothetical protein
MNPAAPTSSWMFELSMQPTSTRWQAGGRRNDLWGTGSSYFDEMTDLQLQNEPADSSSDFRHDAILKICAIHWKIKFIKFFF